MNKYVISLLLWVFLAVLGGITGDCVGGIKIHPTGDATYVYNSHCFVKTSVSSEQFRDLLTWCDKLHK